MKCALRVQTAHTLYSVFHRYSLIVVRVKNFALKSRKLVLFVCLFIYLEVVPNYLTHITDKSPTVPDSVLLLVRRLNRKWKHQLTVADILVFLDTQ